MAWDEGTARDHMQLCTKPARKWAHSRCVWDPLVCLWDTLKLCPRVCSPRGLGAAGLRCGPCSWSPKLLLAPQKCSWEAILARGL